MVWCDYNPQEDKKFKAILGYTVSRKLAWVTGACVSKRGPKTTSGAMAQ